MALRQADIDERLLDSAKKCFLEKGYLSTMLRDVCKKAGVTTGALYKRYEGKEELFDAVVKPAVQRLDKIAFESQALDVSSFTDEQLLQRWYLSIDIIASWFQLLEEVRDGVILLVSNRSDGSKYSNFHYEWGRKRVEIDFKYIEEMKKRNLIRQDITKKELNIILSCFWQLFHEAIIRDFSPEEIQTHCEYIQLVFNWERILGIQVDSKTKAI